LADVALLILATNLFNLLDLRPGRALKVAAVIALAATPGVRDRYQPVLGAVCGTVAAALPAIYAKREDNRGFEGLAISDDGKTLFAGLQSPLENPGKKAAEKSRNTRILAFDTAKERPTAEYVYQFDAAEDFDYWLRLLEHFRLVVGSLLGRGPHGELRRADRGMRVEDCALALRREVVHERPGAHERVGLARQQLDEGRPPLEELRELRGAQLPR
jgi:hypothetical protein